MNIDILVEKYLTGFKDRGVLHDVFENPTRKEMGEFETIYRFIADSKNKKIYVFSHRVMHVDAWMYIGKELHDNRKLYDDPTLFLGAVEGRNVFNWGFGDEYYDWEAIQTWLDNPDMFDWASRWAKIDVWMKKNKFNMEEFVEEWSSYK